MEQNQITFYYGFEHYQPVSKLIINQLQEWQQKYKNVKFVVVILDDFDGAMKMLSKWPELSLMIIDQKDYPYTHTIPIEYNKGKIFRGNNLYGTIDNPVKQDRVTETMIDDVIKEKNEPIIDNSVANLTVTEIAFKLKRDKRNPTLAENVKLQMIQKLKRELRIYKNSQNKEELSRLRNRMNKTKLTDTENARLKLEEELGKKIELLEQFFATYQMDFNK